MNAKAFVTLSSFLLCLLILVLNAEVGLAQAQASDQLDKARRLAYHARFLRKVAKSSPIIEVVWEMEDVYHSLRYIVENGSRKDDDAAKAVGSIFSRTEDSLARSLCLSALKRIGNKVAKKELLRIYHDGTVPAEWRTACAEHLGIEPPQPSKAVEMRLDRN